MKKFIALLLTVLPLFAFAQFTRGTIFLGGTFGTSLQKSDYPTTTASLGSNSSYTSLGLSPSIGIFLNEKFSVGATLSYSHVEQKTSYAPSSSLSDYTSESNSVGIGAFGRYLFPLSSSVYFAVHGGPSFSRGNTKSIYGSPANTYSEGSYYTVGLNFKPVLILFPSPKWGIEASVGNFGYNYSRNLPDNGSTNAFGLSWGQFSFGVSYYFVK